ncbi:MAG: DUF2461 domain-containing protein [Candidatus Eisenbacteria bacterium]|nr:DUF2461 domain-containing protein [Candidatus Eisenbacteria bacterium]
MSRQTYFTPGFYTFLTQLARNNRREWFNAHKESYESDVRDPMLRFIAALAPRLRRVAPRVVVDPRPVGGSMMRIYRDTRFSRDKSPYKTAVAGHFRHERKAGESTPAFYLHLAPGRSFAGAGIWRAETPALKRIRDAIAADPKRWRRVTSRTAFGAACGMVGESLKRVPAGYDPASPVAEDFKRKDFAISAPIADRIVTGPGVLDTVIAAYRSFAPFTAFLCEAIGLPF